MFSIEFTNGLMDFEKPENVTKNNYKFSNQTIYKNFFLGFYFPAFLQNETFNLQYMTIDNATGEVTWINFATLSNTYKETGYFLTAPISTEAAMPKHIRVKAGDYYSKNIFLMVNEDFEQTQIIENFTIGTENFEVGTEIFELIK